MGFFKRLFKRKPKLPPDYSVFCEVCGQASSIDVPEIHLTVERYLLNKIKQLKEDNAQLQYELNSIINKRDRK